MKNAYLNNVFISRLYLHYKIHQNKKHNKKNNNQNKEKIKKLNHQAY
jgi:hypothetical protein